MSWILTHSGKHFDFVDPQPDQICIEDIAWALPNICRYTGHCKKFYSVAEHSMLVSSLVPPEYKLEALLHDASEAYLNDISSPLKQLLPDYKAIEERVEKVIHEKFKLKPIHEWKAIIKEADLKMLATERRDLLPKDKIIWELLINITPLDLMNGIMYPLSVSPYLCRRAFMKTFKEITSKR